jgi:hypothetical protein
MRGTSGDRIVGRTPQRARQRKQVSGHVGLASRSLDGAGNDLSKPTPAARPGSNRQTERRPIPQGNRPSTAACTSSRLYQMISPLTFPVSGLRKPVPGPGPGSQLPDIETAQTRDLVYGCLAVNHLDRP